MITPQEDWPDQAKCRDSKYDPELWFSEVPGKSRIATEHREYAKAICGLCPVRQQCLDLAMAHESGSHWHRFGIYGGLTPAERARLHGRGAA